MNQHSEIIVDWKIFANEFAPTEERISSVRASSFAMKATLTYWTYS